MYKFFPTLIGEFDLSNKVDNKIILEKINASGLIMHGLLNKGLSSYVGGNDCAITRLAMNDLKTAIHESLDIYCREAGLESNVIINSWCNVLNEGGFVKKHRHEKSILSGAYYPCADLDDAPLLIDNPNTIFKMSETKIYNTDYNAENIGFTTKTGKLLIWPSYLYHETQRNGSEKRYTISFNTLDVSYKNIIKED